MLLGDVVVVEFGLKRFSFVGVVVVVVVDVVDAEVVLFVMILVISVVDDNALNVCVKIKFCGIWFCRQNG